MKFTVEELDRILNSDVSSGSGVGLGLYREGYRTHGQDFWGIKPASAVSHLVKNYPELVVGKSALAVGAGTGKNIFEIIRVGCSSAVAVEIDSYATLIMTGSLIKLEEAGVVPENMLKIYKDDAMSYLNQSRVQHDVVISYGLLHVFKIQTELDALIIALKNSVKPGGVIVLQSITDKHPAPLSQPELSDVIVSEATLMKSFSAWNTLWINNEDITHSHAGAEDQHRHGSVRIIAQKGG